MRETLLVRALARWGLEDPVVEPISGQGCSGATVWLVREASARFVAKLVDPTDRAFAAGLDVSEKLAAQGFPSGPPRRTSDGELTVPTEDGVLAVLSEVPGQPADLTDPGDLTEMGRVLARVHNGLARLDANLPETSRWPWRQRFEPPAGVELPPDLARGVRSAVAEAEGVSQKLTHGLAHGDPNPFNFRLGGTGAEGGLIDWGCLSYGPLLYDLATVHFLLLAAPVVMSLPVPPDGFQNLLAGYLPSGLVGRDELRQLAVLNRMCAAQMIVQAWTDIHRNAGEQSNFFQLGLRVACEQLGVTPPAAAAEAS